MDNEKLSTHRKALNAQLPCKKIDLEHQEVYEHYLVRAPRSLSKVMQVAPSSSITNTIPDALKCTDASEQSSILLAKQLFWRNIGSIVQCSPVFF